MLKLLLASLAGLLASSAAHAQDEGANARDKNSVIDRSRAQAKGPTSILPPRARKKPASAPALPADLVAGTPVRDAAGVALGSVDSVRPTGVVIDSALGKIEVDAAAIRKDAKGLFLVIAKERFDALVVAARAKRVESEAAH